MGVRVWVIVAACLMASCSSSRRAQEPGRVQVAITVDWEGAFLSSDGLDALDELRAAAPDAPITHFVSAAYFTKARPDPVAARYIAAAVRPGDELAVHVHAWRSLVVASKLEPRLHPSFLTGTDQLVTFEDGDLGFDTDLDVYSVTELRALLRTSRDLLAPLNVPVSTSFRAGGYLGTPKVLQALVAEGFAVDSSAIAAGGLGVDAEAFFAQRVKDVWSEVGELPQPYLIELGGSALLELPIAAIVDHTTAAQLVKLFEAAHARLAQAPDRDVFVVIGLHQETAAEVAGRLREALQTVRERGPGAGTLRFTTIEEAARRARPTARVAPRR